MNPFQLKPNKENVELSLSEYEEDTRYAIQIVGNGVKVIVESKTMTGTPELFEPEEVRIAEAYIKEVLRPACKPTTRIGLVRYRDNKDTPLVRNVSTF